ncbi:MAG: hypothetical protein KKF56_05320 [Nanoarchaeota archaeon]|nr:hypothetical protein [Nanoarchaeota archaeon]
MKELTINGIKDIDEVKEIEIPSKEPETFTKQEKKEYIRESNKEPIAKQNGIMAISKSKFYLLLSILIVVVLLFGLNIIWSNVIFSGKDFASNVTIENINNIDTPDVPITQEIQNDFTIENKIEIPVDIQEEIDEIKDTVDKILDEVKNQTA